MEALRGYCVSGEPIGRVLSSLHLPDQDIRLRRLQCKVKGAPTTSGHHTDPRQRHGTATLLRHFPGRVGGRKHVETGQAVRRQG